MATPEGRSPARARRAAHPPGGGGTVDRGTGERRQGSTGASHSPSRVPRRCLAFAAIPLRERDRRTSAVRERDDSPLLWIRLPSRHCRRAESRSTPSSWRMRTFSSRGRASSPPHVDPRRAPGRDRREHPRAHRALPTSPLRGARLVRRAARRSDARRATRDHAGAPVKLFFVLLLGPLALAFGSAAIHAGLRRAQSVARGVNPPVSSHDSSAGYPSS
jgi:hypothetical protein